MEKQIKRDAITPAFRIITRKENESFLIGDDIVVTIFKIRGNQVRIGIEAPKEFEILRDELLERETEEQSA